MKFFEVASFEVAHGHLGWPWIAFDAARTRFAFLDANGTLASRAVAGDAVVRGASFAVPADFPLPTAPLGDRDLHDFREGLHAFAISPAAADPALAAFVGIAGSEAVLVTSSPDAELARTTLASLLPGRYAPCSVAFDRRGARLWISVESSKEQALVVVDARSHALVGIVRGNAFPPPAVHELFVHPEDDAVLLLAACGQDGTFARVAGWSDGPVERVTTALDEGSVPAGFVGFSADGNRVHLVEADELRTHSWPGLEQLSSVDLADDFASSYSGAVLGERIFIDGDDADSGEEAVMTFDRSALRGSLVAPPVPSGMWAGRVGEDMIVVVSAKGDPAEARVVRIPVLAS